MIPSPTTLEHFDDPRAFLAATADHLAVDPVLTTVVATAATRAVRDDELGRPRGDHPCWWLAVRDADRAVVGVVMRTAPFEPHPLYVLPMPDDAAIAVARALHERGEHVVACNGALPAAVVLARETARLTGGAVEVWEHTRLLELSSPSGLVAPTSVAGRLRPAVSDDLEVCLAWFRDFDRAAAEQAGRPVDAGQRAFDGADVRRRIDDGRVALWEVDGDVVHLTGFNPPAFGVVRVGPVYTPAERRGHGYAGAAVAEVSRRVLAEGHRACLFTDQANLTSNRLYESIGYRPVVDMANVRVLAGTAWAAGVNRLAGR